jgi:hypothetical protein
VGLWNCPRCGYYRPRHRPPAYPPWSGRNPRAPVNENADQSQEMLDVQRLSRQVSENSSRAGMPSSPNAPPGAAAKEMESVADR